MTRIHLTIQPMSKYLIIFLLLVPFSAFSQEIYLNSASTDIEDFLSELAIDHIIPALNSVAKPYSRQFIAKQLLEASLHDSLLTTRQKQELQMYMNNYRLEIPVTKQLAGSGFSYDPVAFEKQGKVFRMSFRPMIGFRELVNGHGSESCLSAGAGVYSYLGKHIGISAEIYREFDSQILSDRSYFTSDPGGHWRKYSNGGGDYTEWTGQISYSWKWGMAGIFKERFRWGDSYFGPDILSDKAPAFPTIRIHAKPVRWIEFWYFHGWLVNDFTDNPKPDYDYSQKNLLNAHKFMAANILTVTPWKYLSISAGNSILYDGNIQLAYLIPVMFYKSIDHTLNMPIENQNSQMFFSISSRQIRHLDLYLGMFFDEFMVSRIWNSENNFISWKGGLRISNLLIRDLSLTVEGTRTLPMVYQHFLPNLTYESDGYCLGNWLKDNSQEFIVAAHYRPVKGMKVYVQFDFAQHGDNFIYTKMEEATNYPLLKNITWEKKELDAGVNYWITSNVNGSLSYSYRISTGEERFTPPALRGTTNSLWLGLNVGF
ncbi:MAG: hypothetical protein Q8867_07885 [Bacteroidota bacterium]|nr:hypothetical protein [Bacteroidota bacterium]